jgi:DNA-binding response OmpR family regulator
MVEERDNYGYPPSGGKYKGLEPPFDLVILGCPGIRKAEHELINRILEHRDHLLVLSTSLPPVIMRTVFLAGADDVTDKPYDPAKLVNVVSEALDAIKPRDGYQAAAQEVPW